MNIVNRQVVKRFIDQPGLTNVPVWFILQIIEREANEFTETDQLTERIKRSWEALNSCRAYIDEGLVKSLLFLNGYDLFLLSGVKVDRTKTVINDMNVRYEKSLFL